MMELFSAMFVGGAIMFAISLIGDERSWSMTKKCAIGFPLAGAAGLLVNFIFS